MTIGEDYRVENTVRWHSRTHFPQSILINSDLSALYYILYHPAPSIMPIQRAGGLKHMHLWFNFRGRHAFSARQAKKDIWASKNKRVVFPCYFFHLACNIFINARKLEEVGNRRHD